MFRSGEIGKLRVIQVEYAQDWLTLPIENEGQKQAVWRTDPSKGRVVQSVILEVTLFVLQILLQVQNLKSFVLILVVLLKEEKMMITLMFY